MTAISINFIIIIFTITITIIISLTIFFFIYDADFLDSENFAARLLQIQLLSKF
jgi:hypothetical protein